MMDTSQVVGDEEENQREGEADAPVKDDIRSCVE
jgi:hypothetical protein